MKKALAFVVGCIILSCPCYGQRRDTTLVIHQRKRTAQIYSFDSLNFIYPRPRPFYFITSIPRTYAGAIHESFQRKSLKAWAIIIGSTTALWLVDQNITNSTQQFSRYIHLDYSREYKNRIQFKLGDDKINVYQAPDNLNTALYSIGEGMPSILIGAGLWINGLVTNDYRSLSTASQVMQGVIAMGIATQVLKRCTGRESPFVATQPRGKWQPFVPLKTYQENVPHYDAFPSGHMATMMTTTVILSENYPEKKWIKPVGYSVMSIVGVAMINNGVHWASDYPLAIGMGYVFGKVTVKMNRWIRNEGKTVHR